MKKTITPEIIQATYKVARSIHRGKLTNQLGEKRLTQKYNMNLKSAQDYIRCYLKMIQGKTFTHTINAFGVQHYLENILGDEGEEKLRLALESLRLHIEYRKSINSAERTKQEIYDSFIEEYNFDNEPVIYPDEIPPTKKFKEGRTREVQVNAYERNRVARKKCIEHHGSSCAVCDFDFEEVYGEIGEGFIHVHHLKEIASRKKEYLLNPITDLRPVCPNCHAMIHSKKKAIPIFKMKKILTSE
ncbi:HNH endonuclease [Pontiellaceae bacterium B12227]|nr:HNH endonuclease [Pontiellaceae bacterium B12227]